MQHMSAAMGCTALGRSKKATREDQNMDLRHSTCSVPRVLHTYLESAQRGTGTDLQHMAAQQLARQGVPPAATRAVQSPAA